MERSIGFTVNAHRWLPGFDPPYVIANVVLADDPSVHLTTNIVGCEPDEVHIGQVVSVVFEQHEDVWLPLFELTGETDPVDRVPEPRRPIPRAPLSHERFEHKAVLSGIGRSKLGRRLMVDPLSLAVDACLAAVADAGLTLDDIDGLSTYPGRRGRGYERGRGHRGGGGAPHPADLAQRWHGPARAGRRRDRRRHGGGDGAVPPRPLLPHGLGVDLCRSRARRVRGGGRRVSGAMQEWRAPYGALSAANWIGINANQYLHRYGATREMLGLVAITARANAARNPVAIYRDPMTMDDYMAARPITSPFGLYDCDVPCDGSIAVVVSDASVAGDLPKPAVRIEAVGTQVLERISWDQDTVTHEPQVLGQAAHLWTRTGVRPADVDVALLYDGFTFNAVSWIEALGFCGIGEAQQWMDGGRRIALGGELPLNPHGGQLSEGRTHGFGFIHEAVLQLRHEAGERQVRDAKTAVVSTGGGTPSGVLLLQRNGV